MFSKLLVLTFVLYAADLGHGLDLESAKECTCFPIKKPADLDEDWLSSLTTLFYPMMSRLDLYSEAANLLREDPKTINEGEMYYDSQITMELSYSNGNGTITSRGYGTSSREYILTQQSTGLFDLRPADEPDYEGTLYATLTDNRSFIVFAFCSDEKQMTWSVLSTSQTLPQRQKQSILEHVKSLGFKDEFATELRYGQGQDQNQNQQQGQGQGNRNNSNKPSGNKKRS